MGNKSCGQWRFYSPLRYPGGKGELANYVKLILHVNRISDVVYVEPFAGGASVALALLFEEYARRIHINDLNRSVHAFWASVLDQPERFCDAIEAVPMTVAEWHRQRRVQADPDAELFDLGFSTFYMNRTNRSGIIKGGVIGGQKQDGKWKIDARFNRPALVDRVRKVGRYAPRVSLTRVDAEQFIEGMARDLPARSLVYLDPPYVGQGGTLYEDSFDFTDHARLAKVVQQLDKPWIVSYDYDPLLLELYQGRKCLVYSLSYHAQNRYQGAEIIFFSDDLVVPEVNKPTRITGKQLARLIAGPAA